MRALSYFLEEAARSLWRRRGASLLAAATSTASLLVLGLFLLAGSNASRIIERWSAAAELSVYLTDGRRPSSAQAIERALAASGLVSGQVVRVAGGSAAPFQRAVPGLGGLDTFAASEPAAGVI